MKKIIFLFLLTLLSTALFSQWTPQTVPDPKNEDGGYISNPDGILSQLYVDSLNLMIKQADDSGYVQIAVVALNSIGDAVPKEFATELFNYWGIGDETVDNGLLILLVIDQHRVEFETGYGIETVLTDAECYIIQQDQMLPFFKVDDYDSGIFEGVKTSIDEIKTDNAVSSTPIYEDDDYSYDYDYDYHSNFFEEVFDFFTDTEFGIFYLLSILFVSSIFTILLIISLFLKDRYHRYQAMRIFTHPILIILFPVPLLLTLALIIFLIKRWRNTPRISKSGKTMHKLNEDLDDNYLEKGQRVEERIKSIDYDVWITDDKQETLILAYKRWFSKYSQCPKCRYKTYYLEYDKTIRAATYTSSGEGERKHSCANCRHSVTRRYTIPKKQKSSSSSSSYSSWGGGGGSSFGGGSSWGGGSSGGGGAGSSW